MTPTTTARLTQLPDNGSIRDHAIPDLLLAAWRSSFEGVLELKSGQTEKSLVFKAGAPTRVDSSLKSESLAKQLVSEGQLSEEDAERVAERVEAQESHEAVVLLALKLIEPKALLVALKQQLQLRVVETFGWTEGEFHAEAKADVEEDAAATPRVRLDPLRITQLGLMRHWGASRLLDHLAMDLESFVELPSAAAETAGRLDLDEEAAALLSRLDGDQKLGQALGSAARSEKAISALWILDRAGLLRRRAVSRTEAASEAATPSSLEIDIEVSESAATPGFSTASGTQVAQYSTSKQATSGAQTKSEGGRDAGAALRAEVDDKLATLGDIDHFALLGVENSAGVAQIKKAYFKAAKRFHPDALGRLGLADHKDAAAQVFGRIAEAFEILSDPDKRKRYELELSGGLTDIDANQLAQAEENYRKGEILIKMGDFKGAIEYLQSAVELWPDECAYRSGYGWALFRQSASDPGAALEQLEAAAALTPTDTEAQSRLAAVYRALGRENDANRALAQARNG